MIISSEIISNIPQIDGRRDVTELHTYSDGATQTINYLAASDLDLQLVADQRAVNINAEIDRKERALAEAMNFEVPLDKAEFRDLFTQAEREAIDEFNDTYLSLSFLSEAQKKAIRSGLAYYKDAKRIYLSNQQTIATLQMYEALGLIGSGRATEILNG